MKHREEVIERCKGCKKWEITDDRPDILNPSGKCNGRYNGKHEGYGTHAEERACYDYENIEQRAWWKFWRKK